MVNYIYSRYILDRSVKSLLLILRQMKANFFWNILLEVPIRVMLPCHCKSSHPEFFYEKGIFKNCAKFTEKSHLSNHLKYRKMRVNANSVFERFLCNGRYLTHFQLLPSIQIFCDLARDCAILDECRYPNFAIRKKLLIVLKIAFSDFLILCQFFFTISKTKREC